MNRRRTRRRSALGPQRPLRRARRSAHRRRPRRRPRARRRPSRSATAAGWASSPPRSSPARWTPSRRSTSRVARAARLRAPAVRRRHERAAPRRAAPARAGADQRDQEHAGLLRARVGRPRRGRGAEALLADPALARRRHLLAALRRYRPHVLSEPEERILEETANTGRRAFGRLFDELISAQRFQLRHDGAEQELGEEEVLALLYDPDRELRRDAARALTRGLEQNARPLAFIFNTLVQDKAVDDRLRRYAEPMDARNLANEIDGRQRRVAARGVRGALPARRALLPPQGAPAGARAPRGLRPLRARRGRAGQARVRGGAPASCSTPTPTSRP